MKNIQVIDGAENAVYDIFAVPDEIFELVFPSGTDVAFIEELSQRADAQQVLGALAKIWANRVLKRNVVGIHGLLFYGLLKKRKYYPTLRDEDATNPDGSLLR
jgi:hypothetical protein